MKNGFFTTDGSKVVLWGYFHNVMLPVWGWDNWEEVDGFIQALGKLKVGVKDIGDRDIHETILKEFE